MLRVCIILCLHARICCLVLGVCFEVWVLCYLMFVIYLPMPLVFGLGVGVLLLDWFVGLRFSVLCLVAFWFLCCVYCYGFVGVCLVDCVYLYGCCFMGLVVSL